MTPKQKKCPHKNRGKDVCYGDICLVCLDCDYSEAIQNDETKFSFERTYTFRRRVMIDLEIVGTEGQANAVRDAIGLACNDEWLSNIVTPLIHSEEIESVKWAVRGERWVEAKR